MNEILHQTKESIFDPNFYSLKIKDSVSNRIMFLKRNSTPNNYSVKIYVLSVWLRQDI